MYSDILSLIISEYRTLAEKKNIKLTLNAKTLETELVSDSYTVNQIFTQLIDNAIKYTESGKVTVKILRNNLEKLVVEIKDTGKRNWSGISKKILWNK